MPTKERRKYNREYYLKNRDNKRSCWAKQQRKYREDPDVRAKHAAREKKRRENRHHIDRKYGLPLGTAKVLIEDSEGCAVCGSDYRPVIDHDHESGEVRGVLCDRCNVAIGFMDDDADRLEAASRYLRGT